MERSGSDHVQPEPPSRFDRGVKRVVAVLACTLAGLAALFVVPAVMSPGRLFGTGLANALEDLSAFVLLGLLHTVVLGLPAAGALRYLGWNGYAAHAAAGAIVVGLPWSVVFGNPLAALWLGPAGAAGALAYRAVLGPSPPSEDAARF